jgi:hypothetical protein
MQWWMIDLNFDLLETISVSAELLGLLLLRLKILPQKPPFV